MDKINPEPFKSLLVTLISTMPPKIWDCYRFNILAKKLKAFLKASSWASYHDRQETNVKVLTTTKYIYSNYTLINQEMDRIYVGLRV